MAQRVQLTSSRIAVHLLVQFQVRERSTPDAINEGFIYVNRWSTPQVTRAAADEAACVTSSRRARQFTSSPTRMRTHSLVYPGAFRLHRPWSSGPRRVQIRLRWDRIGQDRAKAALFVQVKAGADAEDTVEGSR